MPLTLWKPFRDLQRWEPLQEIESLQREMHRLFDFRSNRQSHQGSSRFCLEMIDWQGLAWKHFVTEHFIRRSGKRLAAVVSCRD
jgi:hypothetical protein